MRKFPREHGRDSESKLLVDRIETGFRARNRPWQCPRTGKQAAEAWLRPHLKMDKVAGDCLRRL